MESSVIQLLCCLSRGHVTTPTPCFTCNISTQYKPREAASWSLKSIVVLEQLHHDGNGRLRAARVAANDAAAHSELIRNV